MLEMMVWLDGVCRRHRIPYWLGSGTLLGFQVIPQWCYEHGYMNNGMMMMPAVALILVGCIIWVHRSINK